VPDNVPTTLLAELTHRCPLHCPYCSNPLELIRAEAELSTDDWKRVFSQARELGVLQLGLSGGEPMLRKDLEELAAHARQQGLYSTLVTSGLGLTRARAERLKAAGLEHIQISIQDSDPEIAERIAGVRSVRHKQAAAALVRELGFAFTINVVLHRANLDRIGEIIDMAAELGADRIEAYPKACYGGWGKVYLVVAPNGIVLPCHGATQITTLNFDNVRAHSLAWIWSESEAFRAYRGDTWMKEPCRSCPRKTVDFGGCRCQAFALTGDAANTDPVCTLTPLRRIIDDALHEPSRPMNEFQYRYIADEPAAV